MSYELRVRIRDGAEVVQLRCPGCGIWADIDNDQLQGLVSVDHTDTGCDFHETIDFRPFLPTEGADMGC